MIHEAYVSFETAKLLKEKGFDWKTQYVYTEDGTGSMPPKIGKWKAKSNIPKVTHQMACAWMREKGFEIGVFYHFKAINPDVTVFDGYIPNVTHVIDGVYKDSWDMDVVKDYNDAVEAAIKYTLEKLI